MASIRRTVISAELTDGSILGPERVIFADKLRLEKSARANNWDINRDEFRVQSFLAFAAFDRTHQLPEGTGYEAFLELLVDLEFVARAGGDEDPTPADTSA